MESIVGVESSGPVNIFHQDVFGAAPLDSRQKSSDDDDDEACWGQIDRQLRVRCSFSCRFPSVILAGARLSDSGHSHSVTESQDEAYEADISS